MGDAKKSNVAQPHDLLVRNVLADADLAANLLQNYLDPGLASAVDLDSLKREAGDTVDPKLAKLVGDMRYSARFKGSNKELKVFVFLEHQSSPDRFMSFRMLGYIHAAYQEMLPRLKKGERFPYPLAVVLHHGESPWKRIPSMRELIDVTPDVEGDILGLPIRLIDVAAMSVDELRGHPMVCALLDTLQSASAGNLPSRMSGIFDRLYGLGREKRVKPWMTALAKYYMFVRGETRDAVGDLTHLFMRVVSKQEAGKMATTMAEALQMEGMVRGVAKGRAEGRVEGVVEGKIESMLTILERRFGGVPAAVQKKIKSLKDIRSIDKAFEMALDCESLKEFQKALPLSARRRK